MSLAIVQSTTSIRGFAIPAGPTFSGAPGVGNLIIVFLHTNILTSVITVNTAKWTEVGRAGDATRTYEMMLYRYAQVGDTATLPALWTADTTYNSIDAYEISGVSGVFANDVPFTDITATASSVSSMTSNTLTATKNGTIALMGGGQYNGANNPTLSGGWTVDGAQNNNVNYGSTAGGHQTGVAATTAISVTINFIGSSAPNGLSLALVQVPSPVETGTASMLFGGATFAAAGIDARVHGDVSMLFGGIVISATALKYAHGGPGTMTFGGIGIVALGADLGPGPSPVNPVVAKLKNFGIQPLTWNIPIADHKTGWPTPEFQQKWLKQFNLIITQAAINGTIVPKSYIDQAIANALTAAMQYTNNQAAVTLAAANAHADAGDVTTLAAANAHADAGDATTLAAANAYTDAQIATVATPAKILAYLSLRF